MDFAHSERAQELRTELLAFMDTHVYPAEPVYAEQRREGDPHALPAVVEELKREARARGLWNLFLPDDHWGAGLTNLEYAPLAEITGRSPERPGGSELFGAGHRQYGGAGALRHPGAEHALAAAAAGRGDPLGVRDDRAGGGLLRRHEHRHPHRA